MKVLMERPLIGRLSVTIESILVWKKSSLNLFQQFYVFILYRVLHEKVRTSLLTVDVHLVRGF